MKYPISHTCVDLPELPCLACGPNKSQQRADRTIAREDLIRQVMLKFEDAIRWFADQLEAL